MEVYSVSLFVITPVPVVTSLRVYPSTMVTLGRRRNLVPLRGLGPLVSDPSSTLTPYRQFSKLLTFSWSLPSSTTLQGQVLLFMWNWVGKVNVLLLCPLHSRLSRETPSDGNLSSPSRKTNYISVEVPYNNSILSFQVPRRSMHLLSRKRNWRQMIFLSFP